MQPKQPMQSDRELYYIEIDAMLEHATLHFYRYVYDPEAHQKEMQVYEPGIHGQNARHVHENLMPLVNRIIWMMSVGQYQQAAEELARHGLVTVRYFGHLTDPSTGAQINQRAGLPYQVDHLPTPSQTPQES